MPNEATAIANPTAITEYNPTVAGLAELRTRLQQVVYDLTTTAGQDAARKDRRECVTLRTTLEEIRQREKAPLLERGRLLDAEAKRITAEILALEEPIDRQIKAREADLERQREAKRIAEAQRVRDIHARIDSIRRAPLLVIGATSTRIAEKLAEVDGIAVSPAEFAEFTTDAEQAKADSMAALLAAHVATVANEAELARLAEERAALAARQAEQERIEREAAAQRVAEEAAARAERERLDALARAQREAAEIDARRLREQEEAEAAARRAEADRLAREQRLQEEKEAEGRRLETERIARETREAEERRLTEQRAQIERQQRELEARQRADAEATAERRRKAEEDRIAKLASDPVKALREIMAVLTAADRNDAEAIKTVITIAGATLRTLEQPKRKAAA